MDRSMHCEDYELDFNINRGWYGGDYLAVVGECECDTWSRWDNWDLQCEFSFFASKESQLGDVGQTDTYPCLILL